MKRILVIIFVALFLVGCAEAEADDLVIHENVNESLAKDSVQVMERLEQLVTNEEQPSAEDETLLREYVEAYEFRVNEGTLSGSINEDVFDIVESSISSLESNLSLASGEDTVRDRKDLVYNYIENGMTNLEQLNN